MAFVCALMSVLGFLLKHRGAVAAPAVEWSRPVASTIALFRSPVYTLGCVVATTSWGFHVAALALAPISIVQSVIAGGLVLVTVLADRVFNHDVSRRVTSNPKARSATTVSSTSPPAITDCTSEIGASDSAAT